MKKILNEEEAAAAAGGARRHEYICDYTVQWGDTLSGIAANFGTTVSILMTYNDIPDPNKIYVNQVIGIYR